MSDASKPCARCGANKWEQATTGDGTLRCRACDHYAGDPVEFLVAPRANAVAALAKDEQRIAENAEALKTLVAKEEAQEEKSPFANIETATLFWRPYGDEIEWRAEMEPQPFQGYEYLFSWVVAKTLMHAGFDFARRADGLSLFAKVELIRAEGERRRPMPATSYAEGERSDGSLCEDGLEIEFGGNVPVQGHGTIDGRICYYRARGSGWSFEVWPAGVAWGDSGGLPDESPEFAYDRDPYAWPDGGWIHRDESIANLREALAAWKAREQ